MTAPQDRGPAPRRRTFFPYAHEGALGAAALVLLGLFLDTLAIPAAWFPPAILVADAPFLWLLWYRGGTRWKRWAFLYGVLHFALATRWVAHVHPAQVAGIGVILGLAYLLFGFAIRWSVRRGLPYVLAVGLCVVLEEMLRTVWFGGMPWPARSLSFAADDGFLLGALGSFSIVPAAAYTGAYGLSFLAGTSSAVVSGLPAVFRAAPSQRRALARRVAVAALVPLAVAAGCVALAIARGGEYAAREKRFQAYETGDVLVAVQANVPQTLKHSPDPDAGNQMFGQHLEISELALAADRERKAFAVLWPETMIPWPFVSPELALRFPEQWANQVRVLRRIRADVPAGRDLRWLVGAIYQYRRGDERHVALWDYGSHDSLFVVEPRYAPGAEDPDPKVDLDNPRWFPPWQRIRHDKVRLVPFGEYTPLGTVLPPLRWARNFVSVIPELDPGDADQEPLPLWEGERYFRMLDRTRTLTVKAGTVVCFELAFPDRCRAWRLAGAQVLLNTANYGWFGETGFRAQIRALARLRSAELAVTVVMAGNTGPTAFFDPLGRDYGTFHPRDGSAVMPAGGDATTFRQGWAEARLRIDEGTTVYAEWGDWPWFILSFGAFGWCLTARRRARSLESAPSADEGIG